MSLLRWKKIVLPLRQIHQCNSERKHYYCNREKYNTENAIVIEPTEEDVVVETKEDAVSCK